MIHSNILSTAVVVCFPREEKGVLNKILYGRPRPEVQPVLLLYTGVPFLTDKGPLSYTFY